jgi:GNAT superfamily N-acetyltransferase
MDLLRIPPAEVPGTAPLHDALATRPLTPAVVQGHGAEDHWVAVRDGVIVARASLWWTGLPSLGTGRLGYVGHYAAADVDAGRALIVHAAHELAAHACTHAIGPIDGTTWRSYRLVVERGDLPPFFLEPQNPPDWPDHFRAAGFDEFASYSSSLVEPLEPERAAQAARREQLEARGYRLRALDLTAIDRELTQLFDVSLAAFARNLLYSPITESEFRAQYEALLPRVDPRLVLLAEHAGRVVGYVFALPDLLEATREGAPARTAIVKTLAVHPDHGGHGLGGVLTDQVQGVARALGYTRVIHALMHAANVSQRISQRYGRPFRRYALFSRVLA